MSVQAEGTVIVPTEEVTFLKAVQLCFEIKTLREAFNEVKVMSRVEQALVYQALLEQGFVIKSGLYNPNHFDYSKFNKTPPVDAAIAVINTQDMKLKLFERANDDGVNYEQAKEEIGEANEGYTVGQIHPAVKA